MNKVAMIIFEGNHFTITNDYRKWISQNNVIIHFTSHSTILSNDEIIYSIVIFYSFKEESDWLNK